MDCVPFCLQSMAVRSSPEDGYYRHFLGWGGTDIDVNRADFALHRRAVEPDSLVVRHQMVLPIPWRRLHGWEMCVRQVCHNRDSGWCKAGQWCSQKLYRQAFDVVAERFRWSSGESHQTFRRVCGTGSELSLRRQIRLPDHLQRPPSGLQLHLRSQILPKVAYQPHSVHRTGHSVDEFPDKAVPSIEPSIPWMNVQQDFSVAVLFPDRLVLGKELVLNFQINKSKLLLFFLLMLKITNSEFVKWNVKNNLHHFKFAIYWC